MQRKRIALITGGYTGEKAISLLSAATYLEHLDTSKYDPTLVVITQDKWVADVDGIEHKINQEDFTYILNGEQISFDFALIALHGPPGENGWLQGYLEMKNIPYNTGNTLNMSLTFQKKSTTDFLRATGHYVAYSILLQSQTTAKEEIKNSELKFPYFVKPVNSGSSLGISKVENEGEINDALNLAFKESNLVMAEQALVGTELTCGVLPINGEITALPVTEIRTTNKFFDYAAKYENQSQEITPAEITEEQTQIIQKEAVEIYKSLNCKGLNRVDFILDGLKPYVIEVNTVPGMSKESLVPQQLAHAGIDLKDVLTSLIEQ